METSLQERSMIAHAKINLCLHVLQKRADGYHDIKSLMQMLEFGDTVTVKYKNEPGIEVHTNVDLPVDAQNIAYRAAELMQKTYQIPGGFSIFLDKKIPIAAGLAGGSTNAAAVMHLINELCELSLSVEQLSALGVTLGADVPFCLYAKPALAEGIGEKLTTASGLKNCYVVLVNPGIGVSTAEIYRALDSEVRPQDKDVQPLLTALANEDLQSAFSEMKNDMQNAAQSRCPAISGLIQGLYATGAEYAMMSGSGATCFGVFAQKPSESILKERFGAQFVAITKPIA